MAGGAVQISCDVYYPSSLSGMHSKYPRTCGQLSDQRGRKKAGESSRTMIDYGRSRIAPYRSTFHSSQNIPGRGRVETAFLHAPSLLILPQGSCDLCLVRFVDAWGSANANIVTPLCLYCRFHLMCFFHGHHIHEFPRHITECNGRKIPTLWNNVQMTT